MTPTSSSRSAPSWAPRRPASTRFALARAARPCRRRSRADRGELRGARARRRREGRACRARWRGCPGRRARTAPRGRPRRAAIAEARRKKTERGLLATVRDALPRDAVHAWDMTILAYWAAAHFPVYEPRTFLYPLGSGTLGYAWPAALGASLAAPGTPGAGGRRGRRLQLRDRRAGRRAPVRARRQAPSRRRRRLRDPARVPARPVRGDDQRRPGPARLPRARARRSASRSSRCSRRSSAEALGRRLRRGGPAVVHVPALLEMWDSLTDWSRIVRPSLDRARRRTGPARAWRS